MGSLYDFLAAVQARKAALGWIDTPSARKPVATSATLARPPEKRELLQACADRDRAAGVDPVPAYF